MPPLVSIVLASYNQKEELERAFNSLLAQTYKNIEIIIVDDCSTDNESQSYIKWLREQHPDIVRYHLQEQNVGIPKNKNTGFRMARGEYLTYLDGDDLYYPEKIEREVGRFAASPELDVVYSNFHYVSSCQREPTPWKGTGDEIHEGNILEYVMTRDFPGKTLYRFELIKASVMRKIGFLDESLVAFEDWDSRIRYSAFARVGYCDNVGSIYNVNDQGISKRSHKADLAVQSQRVMLKNINLLNGRVCSCVKKEIKKKFLEKISNKFSIILQ